MDFISIGQYTNDTYTILPSIFLLVSVQNILQVSADNPLFLQAMQIVLKQRKQNTYSSNKVFGNKLSSTNHFSVSSIAGLVAKQLE